MKAKISEEEMKAAAYYLGLSNLGQTNNRTDAEIKAIGSDWLKIYNYIRGYMGTLAEDDEMYNGMLEECNSFLSDIRANNKDGKFWLKQWRDYKLRLGILN